jgi:hypothetical protein
MKRSNMFLIAMMMLVIAALACSGIGGGGQPGGNATPASGGGAGAGSGGTTPTKAASAKSEKDFSLTSLTGGLKTLKSYKAEMAMTVKGTDDDGQPVNANMKFNEEVTIEPAARRIYFTGEGVETQGVGTFEIITIGDAAYMVMEQDGKKTCISTTSDQANATEGLMPKDFNLSDGKFVGEETVNGIKAKHYAWKENSGLFGLGGATKGKADVWVASDGEFVVKFTAEATGKGQLWASNKQGEGTFTIEYNVTQVNKSFKIEAPETCKSAASDIPVMADAKDKSVLGDMVAYTSASPFADVVKFYKDEMSKGGWKAAEDSSEMEGVAILNFAKDKRKAQVMITEDKDKQVTSVLVTTSEE